MVTFWACMKCERVFSINSTVNKYLQRNHENPHCSCGCGVTRKVTEFHYQQYEEKQQKKVKQSRFSLCPGLKDDPRFDFLNDPHDIVWRDLDESEED